MKVGRITQLTEQVWPRNDEYRNIIRLVREYAEVTKCSCVPGTDCWRCLFLFNLQHYDATR